MNVFVETLIYHDMQLEWRLGHTTKFGLMIRIFLMQF